MGKNPGFLEYKEERKNESFFKILQSADISSENMRAFPYHFVKNFSDEELSRAIKIKTQWGRSWEIKISKNPRFYYMEKSGWDKFLRENGLGGNEFLAFTHRGNLRFSVNIFAQDGKEVLQTLQSTAFLLSSSRIKTEPRQGTDQVNVKKEEEVVLSSDLSYLGSRTAEATGARKRKRKLSFSRKEKAAESRNPESSKKKKPVGVSADAPESSTKKKPVRVSAGSSSSSLGEFTSDIHETYLNTLVIPQAFAKKHMPKEKTKFVIHHSHEDKSWEVKYVVGIINANFSRGWRNLVKEYPLAIGDKCTFRLIKHNELVLEVSKP